VTPHLTTLALAGLLAGIAITFGFILLIVPGLFLLTIWLLIVPAIMLENCGVSASFARSQGSCAVRLVGVRRDHPDGLIFIGVGIVSRSSKGCWTARWLSFALNIVLQTVTAPFLALAWTITYYELRDLKGAEPTAAV
jgi:hypothetical protein